jgi:hypothetical protein
MKILIGVKSCQRDKTEGCHQAIRETWGKNLPESVDVRFFMGGVETPTLETDEVCLPVDDGYWELTPKTRGIANYAVKENYDFVYLCDTDTYLIVPKLLETPFASFDFSGGHLCNRNSEENILGKHYPKWVTDRGGVADPFYVYLSGGVGFFLSRKAANEVATTSYYHHSEDVWVGQVLGPLIGDGLMSGGILDGVEGSSAWHLCCGFYGGGHQQRLSPADAIRQKHQELGLGGL